MRIPTECTMLRDKANDNSAVIFSLIFRPVKELLATGGAAWGGCNSHLNKSQQIYRFDSTPRQLCASMRCVLQTQGCSKDPCRHKLLVLGQMAILFVHRLVCGQKNQKKPP